MTNKLNTLKYKTEQVERMREREREKQKERDRLPPPNLLSLSLKLFTALFYFSFVGLPKSSSTPLFSPFCLIPYLYLSRQPLHLTPCPPLSFFLTPPSNSQCPIYLSMTMFISITVSLSCSIC